MLLFFIIFQATCPSKESLKMYSIRGMVDALEID